MSVYKIIFKGVDIVIYSLVFCFGMYCLFHSRYTEMLLAGIYLELMVKSLDSPTP